MSAKDALNTISQDIKDIIDTGFQFTVSNTKTVPSFDDYDLTFEYGETKRAKQIETCVLYIDIRNSTQISLTHSHQPETLGRLYVAFTKGMMKAAEYHGGRVRNIIGDRIMVVFPQEACFTSSVHCAITMNMVAQDINRQFSNITFKCGIGIDYGRMLVLKTGLYRKGDERNSTRNLVWLGQPANIASKLTDLANKELSESKVKIAYKAIQSFLGRNLFNYSYPALGSYSKPSDSTPKRLENEVSIDEFVRNLWWSEAYNKLSYLPGELESFEKKEIKTTTKAILITDSVFNGYKNHNPQSNDILKGLWTHQQVKIPNFNGRVYGSGLVWT